MANDDIDAIAEALVDELHANPDVTFAGILAGPTFERRIAEVLDAALREERRVIIAMAEEMSGIAGEPSLSVFAEFIRMRDREVSTAHTNSEN